MLGRILRCFIGMDCEVLHKRAVWNEIANYREIKMNIQISTDKNIDGGEKFSSYVNGVITQALNGFNTQITSVGVHFTDQNSSKIGYQDKRCVVEYRMAGRGPAVVTHDADSVDEALNGAVEKLNNSIEHTLGKMKRHG